MTRALTDQEKRLIRLARELPWVPQAGPQMVAYSSKATEILYGGSVGSGKSDLSIGMALTKHKRTLYLRREGSQLQPVKDRLFEILGDKKGFNGQSGIWKLPQGRQVQFGGCPNPGDESKFQGNARDLLVLDEATQFLESQIDFLVAWSRSTDPNQKCRILMPTNPPMGAEGGWIVERFAPWLDPQHPLFPAKPGEVINVNGIDRTFIPGSLKDNYYLARTDYGERLQALPDHLKRILLDGDFLAARDDPEFQVCPSDWVKTAMSRSPDKIQGEISAIGVDPARGGRDSTIIAVRRGWDFDPLIELSGEQSNTGQKVAAEVLKVLGPSSAPVRIDVIGIGASVYDHLRGQIGRQAEAVNVANRASEKSRDMGSNQMGFVNLRAQLWWRARDLLSPESPVKVSLPNDRKLLGDLSSAQYKLSPRGIQVEAKTDLIRRLGRSPDKADAVIMAMIRVPGYTDRQGSVGRFQRIN